MPLLSKHAEKVCARLDLARLDLARLDLARLAPRRRTGLTVLDDEAPSAGGPLLLDTGVYIHQLEGRTPRALDDFLGLRRINHSVVAVQEVLHAIGVLDPADPRRQANVGAIRRVLDGIPSHRLHTPTQDVMTDAAVYAGILCRLQGYAKDRRMKALHGRMKALHDCALFFQARRLGCILLTANVADFDCLQQLRPEGRVLFYAAA
ncbi:DNA-binding protein [Methylobacterium terricola]|uniref:DNA-binding protein n=1 Tax=Methylobacterium terricola TaxID=2583531 RepID=A0A5C4LF37_9HYPH|nr:DNA-binding protein [Methylobacterium terricola]TNC12110.1 DNA-binding protein [Methylobacterium terricola]